MVGDFTDSRLPQHTRAKLHEICTNLNIPTVTISHAPTLSAAETQSVLPENCLVQKTLTGYVADRLILWTGVGDFRVPRKLHKLANKELGLPLGRDHTMNPGHVDALAFYGMRPGMVSPFLIANTPAAEQLAALFILDWSHHNMAVSVAISLSLTESLIVSLAHLDIVLRTYAKAVYGHIPLFTLNRLPEGDRV